MRRALVNVWKISLPFFQSEKGRQAKGLLFLIVLLLLSLTGLNVINSYVGQGFMTAVEKRDSGRYKVFALCYVGVFAGSTIVAVLFQFVQDRLALMWRVWLSRHMIEGYLTRQVFYQIQTRDEVDNPDQRMTEDVKIFTETLLSFLSMSLNATITAIAFAAVLWSITPWLLASAVLYATVGSLITISIGRRLPEFDNLQLRKEADLRYALARVREFAEPIALLQGNQHEKSRLKLLLANLEENFKQIINIRRNVAFFTSGYNYLIQIIPVLIVVPQYVRGDVEFGSVTQAAMAFSQLLGALSLIIAQFQSISSFAAVITRLTLLRGAIRDAGRLGQPIRIVEDGLRMCYEHITLRTPDEGRVLIKDLSLHVERGQRVLITDAKGAGKSALFRATAGLWSEGEGTIIRPNPNQVMFIPQRSYVIPGFIRQQIVYGLPPQQFTDDSIIDVLRSLGLEPVLNRLGGLDGGCDWMNSVSHGEVQLFAIARLLLANPSFAFLDNAVKALTAERGIEVYQLLAATNITYLSVGDRNLLDQFHDTLLELGEGGRWQQISCRSALAT